MGVVKIFEHVDLIEKSIGNGVTFPLLGTVSDEYYVIKTFNNPQGNKILINEFICYHIAKLIGLPIPDIKLAFIDSDTSIDSSVSSNDLFSKECFGLAFCSKQVLTMGLAQPDLIASANNANIIIPRLILFDYLICNKDRNPGNLLYSLIDYNMYIIDHSHTFDLGSIWDKHQLEIRMTEADCLSTDVLECNEYFYSVFKEYNLLDIVSLSNAANFIKEKITIDNLEIIIDKVPIEWESNIEDLNALKNYLLYRLKYIDEFIKIISSYSYN